MPKFFRFFTRRFYKQRNKKSCGAAAARFSDNYIYFLHISIHSELHNRASGLQLLRKTTEELSEKASAQTQFAGLVIMTGAWSSAHSLPSSPKTQNNVNYDIPESHVGDLAGDYVWATLVFTFWAPPSCKKKKNNIYTHSRKLYVVQAGLHFGGETLVTTPDKCCCRRAAEVSNSDCVCMSALIRAK